MRDNKIFQKLLFLFFLYLGLLFLTFNQYVSDRISIILCTILGVSISLISSKIFKSDLYKKKYKKKYKIAFFSILIIIAVIIDGYLYYYYINLMLRYPPATVVYILNLLTFSIIVGPIIVLIEKLKKY